MNHDLMQPFRQKHLSFQTINQTKTNRHKDGHVIAQSEQKAIYYAQAVKPLT